MRRPTVQEYAFVSPGHHLDETSAVFQVPLSRTKDETVLFDAVVETISALVTPSDYVKTDVNTNMGFVIGDVYITFYV